MSAKRATNGVEQAELQEFNGTLGKIRGLQRGKEASQLVGLRP
jgi:hypothetical protein